MRRAFFLLLCSAIIVSIAKAKAPAGPQPFLLFYVHYVQGPGGYLVGTLSEKIEFETSVMSSDLLDSISMHAKLIKKTSNGFRFSWTIIQRVRGKVSANVAKEEFVAWGEKKRMSSIPECTVDVLYSPIPANELKPF